jgi:hypothetical protein
MSNVKDELTKSARFLAIENMKKRKIAIIKPAVVKFKTVIKQAVTKP